jgi:hypothetical protein
VTRLYVEDCLKCGLCVKGQMRFFKAHGLDYRAFAQNGIGLEELEGIEDENLSRVVARARARDEE